MKRLVRGAGALPENRRRQFKTRCIAGAAVVSLALTSCAVGPDFKKPAAPEVSGYTAAPLATTPATPNVAGGEAQRFTTAADIPGDWWTLFHSQALSALIEQAIAGNHDVKAAQAVLRAAHENTLAQKGAFLPQVNGNFSGTRFSTSGALAPTPSNNAVLYNLFTPQVSVAYTPDVFGGVRRTVESAKAQEDEARYQMLATYIALTANVVTTAVQEASLQAQVDATRELIALNGHSTEILRYQLSKGYASRLDLAQQESQLAAVTASLPPLVKQLAQARDQLAVLVGRYPSQGAGATFDLASLQLPQDLPVSLPSALVEQRPDVLQAEAAQHDASAKIGVAIAARLPNIQITGDIGSTALEIGEVFGAGTGFWDLGAAIAMPLFQGGALLHQERAARATYVQASEQYRGTVLTAFQNVADTLVALQQDADALKSAAAAAAAAKVTLDLSQQQQRAGYASTLALLTAEQAYQQARINLVQAQAGRFADTAALFLALGGGWWHRADVSGGSDAR